MVQSSKSHHPVAHRLEAYAQLMRLDKPIGTLLLLWPTLWALWVAGRGEPDPGVLCVFVLGVVVMRAAGCVINDYADRNIDGRVSRTQTRPLAAGRASVVEAWALFIGLSLLALGLVMLMNRLTVQLAFVGIALAASYPFMKRFTYLPQIHLGLAFGWAVPMSFAAQTATVPAVAWLMLIAVVLWAVAYDTMYAIVDREDDVQVGVRSTAILFGELDRPIIGILQIAFLLIMVLIGARAELGLFYYLSLALAAALCGYQQHLIRYHEPAACFQAFLNNNWVGAVIFAGLIWNYL